MLPFEYLGPYRIGEPIGRGGMGTVFKAVDVKTGDEVAVKVIASSFCDDMRFRQRFDAEVKALEKLRHPNIVSLIGQGEESGYLFYSMELVHGESLLQRLSRKRKLPWPFVLDLGVEICSALRHAHNFGIFHRDLKPANLLFANDGSIKLVDFGIAKIFGSVDQTAAGAVLGTADYMAPEQATGGPITPRTDLYALGCVLYTCFAGRAPFANRSLTQSIQAHLHEMPAPLDLIASEVPEEILSLVHALLEKLPEERPPTALAVMNRMKAIRAGLHRRGLGMESPMSAADRKNHQDPAIDSDAPTRAPSIAGSPTILAEDAGIHKTKIPQDELTTHQPASQIDLSSPNTQREPIAVTGRSLPHGTLSTDATPSTAGGSQEAADLAVEDKRQTHFRTVQKGQQARGVEDSDQDASPNQAIHLLSIAVMVSVLLIAAGLFYRSMQRPSADELYQVMLAARDRDDSQSFRSQLDQFKRLYPQDTRAAELDLYFGEVDSARILRRLRLAAVRVGGEDQLAPHEQAFLEAMRVIDRDPAQAQSMLRHWLDVYNPPRGVSLGGKAADASMSAETAAGSESNDRSSRGGLLAAPRTPELPLIARAARQEWLRLSAVDPPPGDVRAEELIERIEWAGKTFEEQDLQRMLEGIVSLYQGKAWAAPAVDLARRRLQELPPGSKS